MPNKPRRIPSLPDHYADDDGHVWAEQEGVVKPLKEHILSNGYLDEHGQVGEKQSVRSVHVLIAEAFLGPRPHGQIIRHKDGVNTDNRPQALVYGTHKDNAAAARRHGTARYGEPPQREADRRGRRGGEVRTPDGRAPGRASRRSSA